MIMTITPVSDSYVNENCWSSRKKKQQKNKTAQYMLKLEYTTKVSSFQSVNINL